jgi:hypothetical protein
MPKCLALDNLVREAGWQQQRRHGMAAHARQPRTTNATKAAMVAARLAPSLSVDGRPSGIDGGQRAETAHGSRRKAYAGQGLADGRAAWRCPIPCGCANESATMLPAAFRVRQLPRVFLLTRGWCLGGVGRSDVAVAPKSVLWCGLPLGGHWCPRVGSPETGRADQVSIKRRCTSRASFGYLLRGNAHSIIR